MATLEKIRNKAGLLVAIVGIALFSFIITDFLNSSSSFINRNRNNVLVINGNAVDYQDYLNRENELMEVYKIQMGTSSLPENYMNQIRQAVYDEVVIENLIDPRLEDLGMVITSEEMSDMIEGENISPILQQIPIFQNQQTGAFDRNTIILFLNQLKNIENYTPEQQAQLEPYKVLWMFWEKNIKRNRLNEKYSTLLNKAIVVNALEAKDAFDNSAESSDIAYLMESFANIPDSTVNVPTSEIEKLYKERKELFRQQETCIIDYIVVDILPSADDYSAVLQKMESIRAEMETTDNVAALTNEESEKKYINAFVSAEGFGTDETMKTFIESATIGDIEGPIFKDEQYRILKLVDKTEGADSVNISIVSVAARATDVETKAYADSLLNVVKSGADFKEIAQNHSIDQWKNNSGEMGWLTEAMALQTLNEEFKKTIFSLATDQSAIVKSNYGYHIVKVTDKTKSVPKYKVADIVYTVTPSSATHSQLYNSLNQFIATNNTIEKMETAAQGSGYDIITNARVYTTDQMIGSVSGARQVVRWIFNSKQGQISEINECDNKFVVAAHKGLLPQGYQSMAAVSSQLKSELIARKKSEQIAAELKAKNLSTFEAYADAMGARPDTVKFISMATPRITNIGVEPKLNALIAAAPLNQISQPIAGTNGVYVFKVINRTQDSNSYDEQRQISMLETNNAYRISSFLFRYMQQSAEIQDNRIRFF